MNFINDHFYADWYEGRYLLRRGGENTIIPLKYLSTVQHAEVET